MMKTSRAGRELIELFEGRRLRSYPCSSNVWTIGVGHTKDVREGMTCTDAQADAWFDADLAEAEAAVNAVPRATLTQAQFDACVSLAFNIGARAFRSSTLARHLSAGEHTKAADQFPRWCRSGGQVSAGLVRRRHAERELFLKKPARTVS